MFWQLLTWLIYNWKWILHLIKCSFALCGRSWFSWAYVVATHSIVWHHYNCNSRILQFAFNEISAHVFPFSCWWYSLSNLGRERKINVFSTTVRALRHQCTGNNRLPTDIYALFKLTRGPQCFKSGSFILIKKYLGNTLRIRLFYYKRHLL